MRHGYKGVGAHVLQDETKAEGGVSTHYNNTQSYGNISWNEI